MRIKQTLCNPVAKLLNCDMHICNLMYSKECQLKLQNILFFNGNFVGFSIILCETRDKYNNVSAIPNLKKHNQ